MCGKKLGLGLFFLYLVCSLVHSQSSPVSTPNLSQQETKPVITEMSSTDIINNLLGNSSLLSDLLQKLAEKQASKEEIVTWLSTLSTEQLNQIQSVLPLLNDWGGFLTKNEKYWQQLTDLIPKISVILENSSKEVEVINKNKTLKILANIGCIMTGGSLGYIFDSYKGMAIGLGVGSIGVVVISIAF